MKRAVICRTDDDDRTSRAASAAMTRWVAMSLLSWPALHKAHPTAHLVVAVVTHVGADEVGTLRLREIRRLLMEVISDLSPGGDFALTLSRANGFPEIHCGFAQQADATALAGVLRATPTDRFAGWASQSAASVDAALETLLVALREVVLRPRREKP